MDTTGKKRLLIVGLGMLGSSLGMALRNSSAYERLVWSRRKEVRDWAVQNDAADRTGDDLSLLWQEAELIVLALPIPQIIEYLQTYGKYSRPGSLVTDLGSVKCAMLEAGKTLVRYQAHYVGSHPMAGTEKSGPQAAFPELYHQASVFVVPNETSREEDVREIEALWNAIHTKVSRITPQEHDELVAHTSHVLHVVASALTLGILDSGTAKQRQTRFDGCATGFKDTSRIASSMPKMWREIVEYNQSEVLSALQDFENSCEQLKAMIAKGDFDGFERAFARGKELRDQWLKYKGFVK